jgi:hypothetical protein
MLTLLPPSNTSGVRPLDTVRIEDERWSVALPSLGSQCHTLIGPKQRACNPGSDRHLNQLRQQQAF